MANIDMLFSLIKEGATSDDLRPLGGHIITCVALDYKATLSYIYARMRKLRPDFAEGTPPRVFLDVMTSSLDSYFAMREEMDRIERLTGEVKSNPLWLAIVKALGEQELVDVESLRARVAETSPADTRTKEVFGYTLGDLASREITERFLGENDVLLCGLIRDGRKVLAKLEGIAASPTRSDQ